MRPSRFRSWRVILWIYAPVLLWLCVIFYLSSGSGSAAETSRIIGPLVKFFFPAVEESTLQAIHAFIRKAAHVTEYAILAALAARVALRSGVSWIRDYWAVLPLFLVAATAAADEFNQSFNAQRTGSPWDVLLDISGGSAALVILWLLKKRKSNADG